jgi:hypothetical protein
MKRDLNANALADNEDWYGNNIAITCPACQKVYVVSGHLNRDGRDCPKCGKSKGVVQGGKDSGGTAVVYSQ